MRTRPRPVSQHAAAAAPPSRPTSSHASRKIFNCIVDDSALVAGVKRSTRNGIRQWVKTGQIRLFVPLHALEELARQKGGQNRHSEDVRETLQWLDEATSKYPNVVALQGADETYDKWVDVERFAVPRTLFSENDHELEMELDAIDLAEETGQKLNIVDDNAEASISSAASIMSGSLSPSSLKSLRSSASPVSPPTSPANAPPLPYQNLSSLTGTSSRPQSSSATVPRALQPLFNYILWRIHQEIDPVAALESFIFLCNDPRKVSFAKGFEIKAKRLEQLREAVSREDRDFKTKQVLLNRENEKMSATATSGEHGHDATLSSSPPKAPAAMLQKPQTNVIDPDTFGRGLQSQPNAAQEPQQPNPKSPRANHVPPSRGSPHRSHVLPSAPRGNTRGNGRGIVRGRGRGGFGPSRGGFGNPVTAEKPAVDGQIDPDSFARPDPRGGSNGSRGGRRLWVPT